MTRLAALFAFSLLTGSLLAGLALPAHADQHDKRLDPLFAELKTITDPAVAQGVTAAIWSIWYETDNKGARDALALGELALSAEDYETARTAFTHAVEAAPDFAEAWNRRATVLYMMGDFDGSVRDIEHTLMLEPRHFGALSGLGLIYMQLGKEDAALRAFKQALAINPTLHDLRIQVEILEKRAKDRAI